MIKNELELSPKSQQIQKMFDTISPKYDFLNRLLSFRQDVRWRNYLVKSLPKVPDKNGVLYDVACGTGDVVTACLKKRMDYRTFIGFDISQGMLNHAIERDKLNQIRFVQASAESLPTPEESAHCVTIAFGLRNVDNREKALKEFHRVLKKDGCLIVLEFFPSQNSFFKRIFQFYFKTILPFVGGLFSDKKAYNYLPNSVETMPSALEFKSLLEKSNFYQVESRGWLSGSTMIFKCMKK
jgi:demethylmenaquinone methyltransferase/2-methoxy-6-polyprenyl-1,4-benzoquinol methylase